jgi:trk system potassium uptake protein TrkA
MINPERELAIDTLRLLQSSVATDIAVLSDTELQVISIPVTEEAPIVGRTLAAIDHDMGDRSMLTAAIQRDGTTLIPTGSTRIEGGDQVYVVTKPDEVSVALALCGHKVQTLKHVMVAGGSREAHYLTQFLINYGVSTTVLVADRERAKDLAERLPKALVLNGDATDVELLELEGVGSVDAFVAVTEEDQTNILSSLVAKHAGAKQVVTLVNKIDYVSLARRIGLDAAVSPRLSAANAIMGHVQRGSVTRVSIFKDTDAEAISFAVSGESPVVGRPLADIEFPKGSIVAAIERNGHVIVPRGSDVLQAGDIAIVFTLPEARGPVKRLFPS